MKTANIILEYQPYIPSMPVTTDQAHRQACSNDAITIDTWFNIWLDNIRKNHEKFESFSKNSVGQLYNCFAGRPIVVAGSGPSLKKNAWQLAKRPHSVGLVSCLHNFHFLEDLGANVDFYVSLDAGEVTIEEVSEGGTKTPDEYWAMTENKTLCCYIGTSPNLLNKWRGKVLFFNAPVPDDRFREEVDKVEKFRTWLECGGNVLGACTMLAKGYLGSPMTIFVGADFSFSNERNAFHPWDSKYDANMGQYQRAVDVYGNTVKTWASYFGFKLWFDVLANRVPGIYINSTEGGCLGAYREGNIMQIRQMDLSDVFDMLDLSRHKKNQAENPEMDNREVFI